MNRDETTAILSIMRVAYPDFYKGISKETAETAVSLWNEMLLEYNAATVTMAVKALIATLPFPPKISDVISKIMMITQPEQMSEIEAWGLISKALQNSIYNSEKEFINLPPIIQRLVGGHSQLRDWAMMDKHEVETVVASNFMRSFKVRAKNEKEYLALPNVIREKIGLIGELPQELIGGQKFERNFGRIFQTQFVSCERNGNDYD